MGRHLVEAALARDHDVTLFNRGRHSADLFPDVEKLRGDRDGDLRALGGRTWDAVVDPSGYFPRVVRASAELLSAQVEHYTFISSASVYADVSAPGVDESGRLHEVPAGAAEEVTSAEAYGGFKALSERAAEEAMPGRVLTVRAGLLVGPYDPTNRFTYWVTRIAEGGDVLAPEPRAQPVQFVDARDLADWILDLAEKRESGVFNATGPDATLTLEGLLQEIVAVTASGARLVWVDEHFLVDEGVEAFQELPLWLAPGANAEFAGFLAIDNSKAVEAGLRFRPLAGTIIDTLAWATSAGPSEPKDIGVEMTPAGLTREKETSLLESAAKP